MHKSDVEIETHAGGIFYVFPGEQIPWKDIKTTDGGWLAVDASGEPVHLVLARTEGEARAYAGLPQEKPESD